jgi:hypothetical protein
MSNGLRNTRGLDVERSGCGCHSHEMLSSKKYQHNRGIFILCAFSFSYIMKIVEWLVAIQTRVIHGSFVAATFSSRSWTKL